MQELVKVLIPIAVAHILILGLVIVVIKRLLLNDTMRAVKRIQAVEAEVRKKEEGIRREIKEHEKAFARQKLEAEEQLQRHKAQTEKELTRMRDQMLTDARKESDRILEQAHKGEEKLRQKIALEMETKAVDYAGQVFKLVFGERVDAEVNKQFNEELLDALEEIDGDSITIDTAEGEVKTSQAMDVEQKRRLEGLLSEKFGHDIQLVERVDADLLSGLVLTLGSLEIDGSLRSRFDEAVQELIKSANV
jgi:F0F1-type ATP synthase membrane subunit b/b'